MEAAFGILGATALRLDGVLDAGWATHKPKAMLAALLISPGRPLTGESLLRWVWEDERRLPTDTTSTLDVYASRIRRLLERLPVPATLRRDRGVYRLDTDRATIDYFQFRDLAATASRHAGNGAHAEAARYAELALGLSRGRPLDDLRSSVARDWRARFEREELVPAHATHLHALIELGRAEEVLGLLGDLQETHQDNLTLHKLRLVTLHALDRHQEAGEYFVAAHRALHGNGDAEAAVLLREHHESLATRPNGSRPVPARVAYRPRQLRHDVRDFVGRAHELSQLDTIGLGADGGPVRGVIVLEGMPGVGKTALAVHWAHRIRSRFPDGDLFVDLHGHSGLPAATQVSVVDELLFGLGEDPAPSAQPQARAAALRRVLTNRLTLVILDNARNSDHVRALVPLLTDCLVVVTSRHSLTALTASHGVRRVRVAPMTQAESAMLLGTRLSDGDHANRADHDLRTEVVRLCGGLPLVITVVGQNIAEYRLRRHTQRIPPRRLLLELGIDADGDTSPRTLFTWSYRALADAPRRLFRLLGLHPGRDFTVAAASACWGRDERETAAALSTLVSTNLLERTETLERYRFHDLVRECAHELAHIDEPPESRHAAERRVLGFYLGSATAADNALYPGHGAPPPLEPDPLARPRAFDDPDAAHSWFTEEHANLMAATAFAAHAGHHALAWRLPHAVSRYLERHGYHEDCRRVREIAVHAARLDGEQEAEAASLADLGISHINLGQFDAAKDCLRRALLFADHTRNEHGQCMILFHLGRLARTQGDPVTSARLLDQSLALARSSAEGRRWTHYELGEALRALGRYDEALHQFRSAESLAAEQADDSARASALAGISAVLRARRDDRGAVAFGRDAVLTAEAARDAGVIVAARVTLAEAERARGALATAEVLANRAAELADRIHNVPLHAQAIDLVGDILAGQGKREPAVGAWQVARDLYSLMADPTREQAITEKITGNRG
ncbi:AfsR/SARP family transcriptional regulator [Actinokineospora inagensis]|uniref:AfsR/SARP family transcriptional regulator n=1 Tax=Actinokineospora inagensis TaxID=103730 RepID=UPI000425C7F8|nr:NB-ARC domain-containing protein [Actinokineospora inagensis]